ncbi:MAG: hypothetical protein PHG97_04890 [Candidatus Margulisbacteria bacterium]|nr:hypothetical protein [Candidatus Margulisiibacteriota bacterium]
MKVFRGGGKGPGKPKRLDQKKASLVFSLEGQNKIFTIKELFAKLNGLNFKMRELILLAVAHELSNEHKHPGAVPVIKTILPPNDQTDNAYLKLDDLIRKDPARFVFLFGTIELSIQELFESTMVVITPFVLKNFAELNPHMPGEELLCQNPEAEKFLGPDWRTILKDWLLRI